MKPRIDAEVFLLPVFDMSLNISTVMVRLQHKNMTNLSAMLVLFLSYSFILGLFLSYS